MVDATDDRAPEDDEAPAGPLTLRDLFERPDGPLLSVGQVEGLLHISGYMIRALTDAGDLRGARIGRKYRIVWASLRNYLFRCGLLPLPAAELMAGQTVRLPASAVRPRLLLREDLEGMTVGQLASAIMLRRCALAVCAATLTPALLAAEIDLLQRELEAARAGSRT